MYLVKTNIESISIPLLAEILNVEVDEETYDILKYMESKLEKYVYFRDTFDKNILNNPDYRFEHCIPPKTMTYMYISKDIHSCAKYTLHYGQPFSEFDIHYHDNHRLPVRAKKGKDIDRLANHIFVCELSESEYKKEHKFHNLVIRLLEQKK